MNRVVDWVIWAILIAMITFVFTTEVDAIPTQHEYRLKNGPTIMMDCARFAQMYSTASIMGTDNFEAWLNHNRRAFNQGELLIYKHEIKMLIKRRNGVAISFPQAMVACGDVWI